LQNLRKPLMSRIVVRVMDTYRLLAIDLDGTLLCPKGTVTARVKSAIHGALDKGYIICFATGRNATVLGGSSPGAIRFGVHCATLA